LCSVSINVCLTKFRHDPEGIFPHSNQNKKKTLQEVVIGWNGFHFSISIVASNHTKIIVDLIFKKTESIHHIKCSFEIIELSFWPDAYFVCGVMRVCLKLWRYGLLVARSDGQLTPEANRRICSMFTNTRVLHQSWECKE